MANTRKQKFREKAATEFVTIVQKGSGPRYKCLGPTATEEATSKPIAPDNIIANQGSRRRQDTAAMEGSGVAPKSTVAPANFKVKAQDNEAKDNTTKQKANLETPAPTNHAPNDPKRRASWVERFGRALMSDRSPDHVGLPYFEGYPWDNPDAVSRYKLRDDPCVF